MRDAFLGLRNAKAGGSGPIFHRRSRISLSGQTPWSGYFCKRSWTIIVRRKGNEYDGLEAG
jgi:hypothetical protein